MSVFFFLSTPTKTTEVTASINGYPINETPPDNITLNQNEITAREYTTIIEHIRENHIYTFRYSENKNRIEEKINSSEFVELNGHYYEIKKEIETNEINNRVYNGVILFTSSLGIVHLLIFIKMKFED